MSRLATSLALLVAAVGTPALAADWSEDWAPSEGMRGSYVNEPKDWSGLGATDDDLGFEAGVRYWYSLGSQDLAVGPDNFHNEDTSHTVEFHLRADDYGSRTYVKGLVGYSAAINGEFSDPNYAGATISDGKIGYAGGDLGWNVFGDGQGSGIGVFAGYQYWNDSPRTSRSDYTTASTASDITYSPDSGSWSVGFDSQDNNLDIHALRLGFSGKAKLGDFFDISAEVAAVPYASVVGTIGGHGGISDYPPYAGCDTLPPGDCGTVNLKSSATEISGWGYGGMAELMAGIHPAENITLRLGGRAWYVQGTYDATWTMASITPPQLQPNVDDPNSSDPLDTIPPDPLYSAPTITNQDVISTANPFSLFRYGLLAELTYSF